MLQYLKYIQDIERMNRNTITQQCKHYILLRLTWNNLILTIVNSMKNIQFILNKNSFENN